MSNTQLKTSHKVIANFDKAEAAKFITPLTDFLKVGGSKLTLRFSNATQDDKTYSTILIKGITEKKNVFSYIEWLKDSIPNLKVTEDCRGSIYELDEVVNLTRIFSNGFNFTFDTSANIIEFSSEDGENSQSAKYHVCDESVIPKPPESLNVANLGISSTFEWNSTARASFIKGAQTLKHEFIVIEGKKGESKITLLVTDNKPKTSIIKNVVKIENPNIDDFRIVLNKENFLNPITSSIIDYQVVVYKKLLCLSGQGPNHKVTYFISAVIENKE